MKLFNWLNKEIDEAEVQDIESIYKNIKDRLSTKVLAFYIATSYIADTIGKCEIKRFIEDEEAKDSFYYLLNISPNINQNAMEFKRKLINKLFLENEVLIFENDGCLYVADSFIKEPQPLKGDKFTNITLNNEKKTFNKKANDVFYFNLGDESFKTLVDSMLDDMAEMLKYATDIYQSSCDEKYKLILDEIKVGDKQFQQDFENVVKKQLESFMKNSKVVYPQFKGYDLERISKGDGKTDSKDVRSLVKEIFEDTAIAFKMPISMLYGNMTNVKEIISSFITFTIDPLATMMDQEFTRKTATMEQFLKGTRFKTDTTTIMHVDIFEVAPDIDKLIASGIYNQDELRVKIGDVPLNTDSSKQYWITKNYSKIEDVLNGEETLEGGE